MATLHPGINAGAGISKKFMTEAPQEQSATAESFFSRWTQFTSATEPTFRSHLPCSCIGSTLTYCCRQADHHLSKESYNCNKPQPLSVFKTVVTITVSLQFGYFSASRIHPQNSNVVSVLLERREASRSECPTVVLKKPNLGEFTPARLFSLFLLQGKEIKRTAWIVGALCNCCVCICSLCVVAALSVVNNMMASLHVSDPFAQSLRTCTPCPPSCIRRNGAQLSRIAVPKCKSSKWRVSIVRAAGSCPFGFKSSIGKGANRELSMEMNVATVGPSVNTTPYAPAPSSEAPDDVNLGPGTYEYLPLKIPYRMTMGIEPLDMEDWIEIDVFYDEEMALRREILESRKEVVIASRPEATEANWEVLEMLVEFLPKRFPDRFRREGALLYNLATGDCYNVDDRSLDPLEVTSRLIQEDVCVMMKVDGTLRLVSGAVLFPQRWQLLEKMGMDMRNIHLPVPLYAEVIGSAVEQFMDRLRVDKPVWRANWAIADDPTLFQPLNEEDIYAALQGKVRNPFEVGDLAGNVGSRLYTRSERETLVRLPRSGAILFTIRTYIRPLTVFESRPLLAEQMVRALETLPDSITKYKTMAGFYDVALKYLRDCAAQTLG